MQQKTATVFGGSGFLGRYVVRKLAERGFAVRVACRRPDRAAALRPLGVVGQIAPVWAPVTREAEVAAAVEGASLVINLAAILSASSRKALDAVNAGGAGIVARVSAKAGVSRLVQMSAIGASSSGPSDYSRSRAAGEQAVQEAFAGATITRASVIFGPEDHFLNMLGGIARYVPLAMPVYGGRTRIQPVYVADVAEGVVRAAADPDCVGYTLEFGGPEVMTMTDVARMVLNLTGREKDIFQVPSGLARLQAAFLERLPGRLLTRDQLKMLLVDNVVSGDMPGLAALFVSATPLDLIAPSYMERYAPGGGKVEIARYHEVI
ncbi:complex I NDUFA9 subunit family protein [Acetobacter sp. AN02]|uniref:complex I NDUFA9 subunit family protein n=1 Tax=Acetobacter sp. AN02 TaxID=2894186 RepID=UPI00325F94F1